MLFILTYIKLPLNKFKMMARCVTRSGATPQPGISPRSLGWHYLLFLCLKEE